MEGNRCSPYPHYSWLAHWIGLRSPRVFHLHVRRHVGHSLLLTTTGDADIVWTTREAELAFHVTVGSIGFFPCDRYVHSFSITAADGFAAYHVTIPEKLVRLISMAEDLRSDATLHATPVFRDFLMQASLLRLSSRTDDRQMSEGIGDEVAARQIVRRLCALTGSRPPDWRQDSSVFVPSVMRQIVECIDAHLVVPLTLTCMAEAVGLSSGHFARKFRYSAGESLERFTNRRRVGASFVMLRNGTPSLAQIALDLGFSSQSHFTRLFSKLTGLTPQQFRRMHQRMAG